MNQHHKELEEDLRKAIGENGELKITWDCGGDDTLLNFAEWGSGFFRSSHPHHGVLTNLEEYVVDFMELPNTGGVSDKGHGKIFIDSNDDKIKLYHSSAFVDHEIEDVPDELEEFVFQDGEFELKDLEAPSFRCTVYLSCRLDAPELWNDKSEIKKLFIVRGCKPDIPDNDKAKLTEALWPRVEPLVDSMSAGKKHVNFIDGFEASVSWHENSKMAGYNIEPSFGTIHRLSQQVTEELF